MLNAGFESGERHKGGAFRPGWVRWAAIACIVLLAFAATVQVSHSHADDKSAEHCQICFAIHSAMPVTAAATVVVFTQLQPAPVVLIHAVRPRFWISPFANGPPALRSV